MTPAVGMPVIDAPAGAIRGRVGEGVHHWTGIRYAHAGRYEPPRPTDRVERIDATVPAAACPQAPYPDVLLLMPGALTGLGVDEECQRLSVHAPADREPDEALPVVVFIHGGAYVNGAGDSPYYDPTTFVREQRVIWVAVTYRLGVLGYLPSAVSPGNLGLLDQIEALRWVQRNIAAFGGDPDQVTIMGQSAGGDAVAHLMISDGTAGLFHRVISQSPPLGMAHHRGDLQHAMASRLESSERALGPIDHLMAIQERIGQGAALRHSRQHLGMPYSVQYGAFPLPAEDAVGDAWARVAPHLPVLMGTNVRETAFYLPKYAAALSHRLRGARIGIEAIVRRTTHRVFDAGVDAFTARHAAHGGLGHRYSIDWGPNDYHGSHVIEMPLLFGAGAWRNSRLISGAPWEEVVERGAQLRDLWGAFIRTGTVPNGRIDGLIDVWDIDVRDA